MKKLARQSAVLGVLFLLTCVLSQVCIRSFSSYYPVVDAFRDETEFHVVTEDEDTEDTNGRVTFGEPEPEGDHVRLAVRARERGKVSAHIETGKGQNIYYLFYYVGPGNFIYDYTSGRFTGDLVVIIAATVFLLAESFLLLNAFRRAKGPDFYSYSTIYMVGFGLFLLLTGVVLLTGTVRLIRDPVRYSMFNIYSMVSSAGLNFMLLTSPLVLAFAAAMTVSNIALLRHESRRLKNVLGLLTSILVIVGEIPAFYVTLTPFVGAESTMRLRSVAINTYAAIYGYFECMLIGAIICGLIAAKHVPAGNCSCIIILGCYFRKDGSLPPLIRGRVDRAISFWKEQKERGADPVLIPSGGQGPDETMPEAEAMRRYLIEQEIPEESIVPEDKSANTYQNMAFSKKLIKERGIGKEGEKIVFSTTNYHVFRSGVWASLADLKAEGIGSNTKWWYWPNAFMRECLGLLVNRWRQEMVLLIFLVVLFLVLSFLLSV